MCGNSPSPPPAPDYIGAAKQQGIENLAAARAGAKLSNPNITSPLGTRTVTYGSSQPTFNQAAYDAAMKAYTDRLSGQSQNHNSGLVYPPPGSEQGSTVLGFAVPDGGKGGGVSSDPNLQPPKYSDFMTGGGDPDVSNETITLSPEQQKLYEGQVGLSQGLLNLGQNSLDQTGAALQKSQDFGSVQDIADQAYKTQTARLDPQWAQQRGQQATTLANQGVSAGSEAYDNAMRVFNQGQNDAYTQARQQAISTMPQTFQLAAAQRMQPLTELNAIRSGSQPQMPQFQPYSGTTVGAAPIAQAVGQQAQYNQGLYNSQVGQQNSMMGGLFGLGGSIAGALPWEAMLGSISDRRLKSNIVRIGDHPLGIGIYEYDIFGKRDVGVMADEVLDVKPEAVLRHPSGFLMVDYGRL